uniref:Carboxypeptidase n=1 Tax=Amblyomma maculatum TaxID=34609 RepID=G3MPD5_AMBMU
MRTISLWVCVVLAGNICLATGSTDPGPLFLTPLILNGSIALAKTKSRVELFKEEANVTAYSGYITVNDVTESNLFFLHILAQENNDTAPLMLWTQGGPGMSSLFGQFLQNGPLGVNSIGKLFNRSHTIQKHVNILYVDVPVGAGFSFTKNKTAYASSLEDVTSAMKEFLRQFLCLFPEYTNRDFYVAGESYAGRYSVAIAYNFLTAPNDFAPVKLQGVVAGVPFVAPVFDVFDSSNFLYELSMLTNDGRNELARKFETMRQLAATNSTQNIMQALLLLSQTIFNDPANPTLFENLTSYSNHANALYSALPLEILQFINYVNTTKFKTAVHVGENATFYMFDPQVAFSLFPDIARDITKLVEHVLNETNVLVYLAQMDTLLPAANQRAYLRKLHWKHAAEYLAAERKPWRPHENYYGMAGYVKKVPRFTEVLLLEAGHYASFDRPDEVYHLMYNFTTNKQSNPNEK